MTTAMPFASHTSHRLLATLAARGESPAASGRRYIPPRGVARRSNTPGILPPRALRAVRLDGLGATRDFHHGLLARLIDILIFVFVAAVLFGRPVLAQDVQSYPPEAIEQFLLTAEIVGARPIGRGVTNSWRLTLSDGTTTHDAAFQSVDRRKPVARVGRRTELQFADSYHFNIAADRLARLLGLDDLVPV